jgi:hypothetical protein
LGGQRNQWQLSAHDAQRRSPIGRHLPLGVGELDLSFETLIDSIAVNTGCT